MIERRGLPREIGSTIANDAYHFMRTASWLRITVLFASLFIGINLVFAIAYRVGGSIANADTLADCYWFSVQTLATIGYGGMTPTGTVANTLVTVESFVGIGYTALATGVFFARFATPSARVMFSRTALVTDYDGKRMLMFRMANARATAIVEATVRLYLSRDEVTASGERVRRIHDLALTRNVTPIFALSWSVYHVLDETSPLHGITADTYRDVGMNIIITFHGTDDELASTVHTRWSYDPEDLEFDRRFVDILKTDPERKVRYLDLSQLHVTEPLTSPTGAST